jgi:transposase
MRQKSGTGKAPAEQVIKDIRRSTRKQYGAEEKTRIVLEGLRGEESIARFAGGKGSPRAIITTGRRNSWKPARSGWLATRPVPPPATR